MTPRPGHDPRVAVVILTWDQRETTLRCLENLGSTLGGGSTRVVVWDNGSTDGTVEAVRSRFPEVVIERHPENLGVASGRNAAAEHAIRTLAPTHLLFLDNDMQVTPGLVETLLEPFHEDAGVAQTQAKMRFAFDRRRLNDAGGCRIRFWLGETTPIGFGEVDRGQYDRRTPCIASGGAMMVRADVFLELGGFDAIFDPFGPEDLDFALRAREAGYRALYVPEAVVYHEGGHVVQSGYTEDYARIKVRNWLRFLDRHASWLQKLAFYVIGAPWILLRMILRELRRGNLAAVRGTLAGAWNARRSAGR